MTSRTHRPVTTEDEQRTPQTEAGGDEVRAQFDSPTHVVIGDGTNGAPVDIQGISFTPGEIGMLVDFVGSPDALFQYSRSHLTQIRAHIDENLQDRAVFESSAFWDPITAVYGTSYSELAQANEDHFAPAEGGGPSFESSFLGMFATAVRLSQSAAECEDADQAAQMRNMALTMGYGAEHYLQDAYSSGHQVSADVVTAAVDQVVGVADLPVVAAAAATFVYDEKSAEIGKWERRDLDFDGLDSPLCWNPIDTLSEWVTLAELATIKLGQEGIHDAVRQEVHERLAESTQPVMVTSELHPDPFALGGDHEPSPESLDVLRYALQHVRDLLAHPTAQDPDAVARGAWERVRTQPTTDTSALVTSIVTDCTKDQMAVVHSLANATSRTLPDVLGAFEAAGLVRLIGGEQAPTPEHPEQPTPSPEQPAPEQPATGGTSGWTGWADDFEDDGREDPWVRSQA